MLAQSLKTEIRCVEDLFTVIENSPIRNPKPTVQHLWFTYDWQDSIKDCLTEKQLENHSFYNSFRISKSDGKVLLQAKPLPQDSEWGPATGIQILKTGVEFPPVSASEFRVEDLNLGKAMMSLKPYFAKMPEEEAKFVSKSWENLFNKLEGLPRRRCNLGSMKISELPKQCEPIQVVDVQVEEQQNIPPLKGQVYPAHLEEGVFTQEVNVGVDVALYTRSKRSRPWLGRVTEIDSVLGKFKLQWFSRRSRGTTFYSMENNDGSPFVSEQEFLSVMLWGFSENQTNSSFTVAQYWLDRIAKEAEEHDKCYE